ncbi:hypothetical protein CHS0354_026220 [Potamilus streckersoni]|uniref:Uncharacterized protein n=1 Tax=Potamilus streckersoni TaxID=2493646 RepID=A0AAE0TBE7_9BIVA|nr:hypothetical protein CHS0354_026220 [Potamilus streckersoni]
MTTYFPAKRPNALVTISADKLFPRDGETVNLICSIPSFILPASWIANSTGVSVTICPPSGPCQPPNDAARYTYSATSSTIGVTITSFKSVDGTFGWKCQYGTTTAVYVIKHAIPVTTVQLTDTADESLTSTLNVIRGGIAYIRCSTAPLGSRPPATFRWYSRPVNQSPVLIGNQSISSIPQSIMVPGQSASDLLISYSTLTQTGDTLYQNMYIFCEARDEMSTGNYTQSGEAQLNIVYPPVVQLSPNYPAYNVTEGTQNFVFTCKIIEANPLPKSNGYSWLHWSLVIQGQTSSSYTLPSVQKSNDGEFQCTARNDYGSGTSKSVALNVQYPPSILGLTSPYKVIEYQPLNVSCQVSSNPLPDKISWSPIGESSVQSRLYFSSVSRNKSGNYSCTAQNTMTPTAGGQQTGINTSQIQVDVLYPPSIHGLTSPYTVIEYQPLNVTCQVSSNPLPDKISWSPIGESSVQSRLYFSSVSRNKSGNYSCIAQNTMTPTVGGQQTGMNTSQIQVDVMYPPSIQGLISPYKVIEYQPLNVTCEVISNPPPDQISWSPVGESSVPSRLYFHSMSRNKSGNYICTAQNTMTPTVGRQQTGMSTRQIQVDVMYPPSLKELTSPYKVIEYQPLNVTCQVSSNPPPDKISWSPIGESSVPSRLYFSTVSRNKSGTYSCTAQNTMTPTAGGQQTGMATSQIQVDVLYPATITEFLAKDNITEIMENSTFHLYCHVDSNPYSVISLTFGDVLISMIRDSFELAYSATAGCLNAGKYICSATNSIMNGVTMSADINLKVQCHPRLDFQKNISVEYYRALNDNITLEVSIIAYPEPTNIMWFHRAAETDLWERVLNQSFSSTGLHSDISVHLGSQRDFGHYLVNMSNSFGIYELVFHVIPESVPGIPTDFSITDRSYDSITLEWIPGFWGGYTQNFTIEYRLYPHGTWMYRDSILEDTNTEKHSFTVNGLQQKTTYEFRMYARNKIGLSNTTQVINTTTSEVMQGPPELQIGLIAGGVASGAIVAVICIILVIILLRRRNQENKEGTPLELEGSSRNVNKRESGLVDNPVYETSDPRVGPSTSKGTTVTEYAAVVKPKKKVNLVEDPSKLYAQVDKTNKNGNKGAAKGKQGKGSRVH